MLVILKTKNKKKIFLLNNFLSKKKNVFYPKKSYFYLSWDIFKILFCKLVK